MGCGSTKDISYLTADPKSTEKEGETIPHVNKAFQNWEKYVKEAEEQSMIGDVLHGLEKHANRDALGYRKPLNDKEVDSKFSFLKYKEVMDMAYNLSHNIANNKLVEEKTFDDQEGSWKIMGIFARNCVEWVLTDLACQLDDITTVTFYSTLGSESFDHIFEQTNASTVCVSPESIAKLVEFHKKYEFKSLKNVIVYDMTVYLSKERTEVKDLLDLNINVLYFSDLVKKPEKEAKITRANPNSVLTLCYTSGTTSLPKGAMLTQKGFACQKCFISDSGLNTNENDVILSYLPLAHVMERLNILLALSKGVKVGFISGTDVKKWLMEDLPLLKPTIFVTVPRILVNFHQKVLESFTKLTGCKKSMAESGLKSKRENYDKTCEIKHWYYDSLVFSKVKAKFGGNVRCLVSGSAPLPKDVSRDIKLLMSCPLLEGYGMTELHGASNATDYIDLSNNNVGGVLRVLKVKLVDKRELNYHSKTEYDGKICPTGEICYYGPAVFKGYFRDAEKTREAIDSDGWLHTGDVGMIDPSNQGLKIVDRVKEIFKLSQGEYIAPAKLEGMYAKSPFAAQICVYGNSEKSYIIAIVVLNKVNCANFLKEKGVLKEESELSQHLENADLLAEIKKNFEEIGKESKFSSLERPGRYILTLDEFTVQNDMLTPTMKLVRKKIQNYFQEQINKAYGS